MRYSNINMANYEGIIEIEVKKCSNIFFLEKRRIILPNIILYFIQGSRTYILTYKKKTKAFMPFGK